MSQDIQAAQEASPETQAILKEMQAEGHEIEGLPPAAPATDSKPAEKPVDQPPVKPDTKPEEPPQGDPPESPKADPPPKVERTPKAVPVGKYNDERHKRQEAEQRAADLEAQIKQLSKTPPTENQVDDIRDLAKELAEKHGLDADFVAEFADKIVSAATKRNVIPKELEQQLQSFQAMKAQQEAQALEQAQQQGFENEWQTVLKEFPDLADRKEDLKQLAFTEGNERTALRRLALEYMHDNPVKGRKTVESPVAGKTGHTEVIDFENMTEEQYKNLSDEQHDQFMQWVEKGGKRR